MKIDFTIKRDEDFEVVPVPVETVLREALAQDAHQASRLITDLMREEATYLKVVMDPQTKNSLKTLVSEVMD